MGREFQESVKLRKTYKRQPTKTDQDHIKNPFRDIWTAVLHRAVADLELSLEHHFSFLNVLPCANAIEFFESELTESTQGSFLWICQQLDLDPRLIQKCLQEKLKSAKIRIETYLTKLGNTIH